MHAALAAAAAIRGATWPNPAVGCVLVDPASNEIIATGVTQKGGRPHAEMVAIIQAGDRARGAHAYVTLEPCNNTSPEKPCSCSHGLINAGVTAVFAAIPDPDPRMMGKSAALLQQAGLHVQIGLCADDAYAALRGHVTRVMQKRPYITLKLAHSTDGKIGLPGLRAPISGAESWPRVFDMRAHADAVMVGVNTALSDDPQLTNRGPDRARQPVRVVLDSQGRLTPDSKLAQTARDIPLWVLSRNKNAALESMGVRCLPMGADITETVQILHAQGLSHILCEGGAQLAQSLDDAGLVDEAIMIEGITAIGERGIPCPKLFGMMLRETLPVGDDTWRVYDSVSSLKIRRGFFAASEAWHHPKDAQA